MESKSTIASLTMLYPGGHHVVVTVYLERKTPDSDWGYWATWSVPAIREGRARYLPLLTGIHDTLIGAITEAVSRIQEAEPA